MYLKFDPTNFF